MESSQLLKELGVLTKFLGLQADLGNPIEQNAEAHVRDVVRKIHAVRNLDIENSVELSAAIKDGPWSSAQKATMVAAIAARMQSSGAKQRIARGENFMTQDDYDVLDDPTKSRQTKVDKIATRLRLSGFVRLCERSLGRFALIIAVRGLRLRSPPAAVLNAILKELKDAVRAEEAAFAYPFPIPTTVGGPSEFSTPAYQYAYAENPPVAPPEDLSQILDGGSGGKFLRSSSNALRRTKDTPTFGQPCSTPSMVTSPHFMPSMAMSPQTEPTPQFLQAYAYMMGMQSGSHNSFGGPGIEQPPSKSASAGLGNSQSGANSSVVLVPPGAAMFRKTASHTNQVVAEGVRRPEDLPPLTNDELPPTEDEDEHNVDNDPVESLKAGVRAARKRAKNTNLKKAELPKLVQLRLVAKKSFQVAKTSKQVLKRPSAKTTLRAPAKASETSPKGTRKKKVSKKPPAKSQAKTSAKVSSKKVPNLFKRRTAKSTLKTIGKMSERTYARKKAHSAAYHKSMTASKDTKRSMAWHIKQASAAGRAASAAVAKNWR